MTSLLQLFASIPQATRLLRPFLLFIAVFGLQSSPLAAEPPPPKSRSISKSEVRQGLIELASDMDQHYILKEWKKEFYGWDVYEERDLLLKRLESEAPYLSFERAKTYYLDLFLSAKDQHLGFRFTQQRLAALPFGMICIEGRYFVSCSQDPRLKIGDEIVAMDGLSPLSYARERRVVAPDRSPRKPLQESISKLIEKREALLASFCTVLDGACNSLPEKRSIMITTRPKGSEQIEFHLLYWSFPRLPSGTAVLNGLTSEAEPLTVSRRTVQGKEFGIISLSSFCNFDYQFAKKFYFAVGKLRKECDALVLDLQDNGGGNEETGLFVAHCLSDRPTSSFSHIAIATSDQLVMRKKAYSDYRKFREELNRQLSSDGPTVTSSEENKCFCAEKEWKRWESTLSRFTAHFVRNKENNLRELEGVLAEKKTHACANQLMMKPALYEDPMPPLYVQVNNLSASCSEVTTYLLQQELGAKVIGGLTLGVTAGAPSVGYEFAPHWGITGYSIPSVLFYNPNSPGRKIIEDIGVIPDCHLSLKLSDLSPEPGKLFKNEHPLQESWRDYVIQDLANIEQSKNDQSGSKLPSVGTEVEGKENLGSACKQLDLSSPS